MKNEYQEVVAMLTKTKETVRFHSWHFGIMSPELLRQLYEGGYDMSGAMVRPSEPIYLDGGRSELVKALRPFLSDYIIDVKELGEEFIQFYLASQLFESPISDFVDGLVRISVVEGVSSAIQVLHNLKTHTPVCYWHQIALEGVIIDAPTEVSDDMRLSRVRAAGDQDVSHDTGHGSQVVLSVKWQGEIVRGTGAGSIIDSLGTCQLSSSFSPNVFCIVLSLLRGSYINWTGSWNDLGKWQLLNSSRGDLYRGLPGPGDGKSLDVTNVTGNDALEAYSMMDEFREKYAPPEPTRRSRRFAIAVHRWLASTRYSHDVYSSFIDIRVALEAILLPGTRGELSYRLSQNGAWYLGENFEQRRMYRKQLKRAYNLASRIVHAEVLEQSEENMAVLKDAQNLCLKGIWKILREGEEPNFSELSLGRDI